MDPYRADYSWPPASRTTRDSELLHEARLEAGTAWVRSAHLVGITLTAASTLLLIVVTVNYFMNVRSLAAFRRRGIAQGFPRFWRHCW